MDLGIAGRRAVVTGASQGIGRAVVGLLAQEGVIVAAAARRTELVEGLAHEVASLGAPGKVTPLAYDLYTDGAPETLAEQAVALLGGVDIIMNVVGGARPLPIDAPREAWEEAMLINYWAAQRLTHGLILQMCERGWGRVVNFTGTTEPRSLGGSAPAKSATQAWSKALSRTVADKGVTVNCIQPGKTHSEQIGRKYRTREDEDAEAAALIPIGRFGNPIEPATAAVFLASERASFITGVVLPVDGGIRLSAH